MNEKTKQRLTVSFISLLFILSIFGIALQYSSSGNKTKIPENNILTTQIDENQKAYLISQGITYIEFQQPENCGLSCKKINEQIINLVNNYKPYVLYYPHNGTQTKIIIENINGKEDLKSGGIDTIEEKICETIPRHPKCIDLAATKNL